MCLSWQFGQGLFLLATFCRTKKIFHSFQQVNVLQISHSNFFGQFQPHFVRTKKYILLSSWFFVKKLQGRTVRCSGTSTPASVDPQNQPQTPVAQEQTPVEFQWIQWSLFVCNLCCFLHFLQFLKTSHFKQGTKAGASLFALQIRKSTFKSRSG